MDIAVDCVPVSLAVIAAQQLQEGVELSFSQCSCLWLDVWALDFETVRQGKKSNLQLPHPNDSYETEGGD